MSVWALLGVKPVVSDHWMNKDGGFLVGGGLDDFGGWNGWTNF